MDPASRAGMYFGIAPDEVLAPDITLPVQFQSVWHGSTASRRPERTLAISVLRQAADDLENFRYGRRVSHQRLYVDAYAWLTSADHRWPYSFLNLCDALRLSPDAVRAQLLGDPSAGRPAAIRRAAARAPRRPAGGAFATRSATRSPNSPHSRVYR